jgi:DNA-binding GntR family transcriptional regulator
VAEPAIRFQTKTAYAAQMMREAFAEGRYSPGDRLQVGKVAKELGLSLTPVREALFELASEGLVTLEPHRGARVADVPVADLHEVYMIRELLESQAGRLAAERITDEELASLADCHADLVKAVDSGDREPLRALSDQFHQGVFSGARSPKLLQLIMSVASSGPADTFQVLSERPQRTVEEHQQILEALQARDPDRAGEALGGHVRSSLELILAAK